HLGDQHLHALPRGPPLDDVGAEVVGLHEPRQRATLAQRGDVAGGGDGGQHSAPDATERRRRRGCPTLERCRAATGTVEVGLLRAIDPAALAGAPLTYPEVGATRAGPLPAGYAHAGSGAVVGLGEEAFRRAVDAVFGWRAQRAAGLRIRAT